MKPYSLALVFLLSSALIGGCASTDVTARQEYRGETIARPGLIIVHNFAATPGDMPAWAASGKYTAAGTNQTAEDIDVGRKLGAEVAKELVMKIQDMGLPAEQVEGRMSPQLGDLVIIGYFETVDPGSTAKRMALGFGSGAAHLRTVVEGYLMTQQGLRRLGSGEVDSGGSKSPGAAMPLAVAVATGNPIGLIVSTAVKASGEASGKSTIEGSAKQTAELIAEKLQVKFKEQGWI